MQYFNEMINKYGFSDGSAEPNDAVQYREVYVRAINVLAKKHNALQRAIAYDRPGMHNHIMIGFVSVEEFNKLDIRKITEGGYTPAEWIEANDDGMAQAIEEARGKDLDDYTEEMPNTNDEIWAEFEKEIVG